jgi:hypothetical protein
MAAKNVNMVDQAAEQVPLKPLSYGELVDTLKQATNAFVSLHFSNILSAFIKDHQTVQHIVASTTGLINLDHMIKQIQDHLAAYTVLDSMAEEHIGANNWRDGEEFASEGLRARFNSNGKNKVHSSVVNNSVDPAIYRNHVMRFFQARQQRKRKEKTELANKLLTTLSSSIKPPTTRTTSHS